MAKAIKETCSCTNLNISTAIRQACVATNGVMGDHYQVKRNCTKTDNTLKSVMKAHLKQRASHYS